MRRARIPFAFLLLVALGACHGDPTLPHTPPTEVGPIVAENIQWATLNGRRSILVRPDGAECGTAFIVRPATRIRVRNPDGTTHRGTPLELTIGRVVRAWSTGVVLRSCPGQTTAAVIEVIS